MSRHPPESGAIDASVAPDPGKTDESKSGAFGPTARNRTTSRVTIARWASCVAAQTRQCSSPTSSNPTPTKHPPHEAANLGRPAARSPSRPLHTRRPRSVRTGGHRAHNDAVDRRCPADRRSGGDRSAHLVAIVLNARCRPSIQEATDRRDSACSRHRGTHTPGSDLEELRSASPGSDPGGGRGRVTCRQHQANTPSWEPTVASPRICGGRLRGGTQGGTRTGRCESSSRSPRPGARTVPPGCPTSTRELPSPSGDPRSCRTLVDPRVASVAAGNASTPTIRRSRRFRDPAAHSRLAKPDR